MLNRLSFIKTVPKSIAIVTFLIGLIFMVCGNISIANASEMTLPDYFRIANDKIMSLNHAYSIFPNNTQKSGLEDYNFDTYATSDGTQTLTVKWSVNDGKSLYDTPTVGFPEVEAMMTYGLSGSAPAKSISMTIPKNIFKTPAGTVITSPNFVSSNAIAPEGWQVTTSGNNWIITNTDSLSAANVTFKFSYKYRGYMLADNFSTNIDFQATYNGSTVSDTLQFSRGSQKPSHGLSPVEAKQLGNYPWASVSSTSFPDDGYDFAVFTFDTSAFSSIYNENNTFPLTAARLTPTISGLGSASIVGIGVAATQSGTSATPYNVTKVITSSDYGSDIYRGTYYFNDAWTNSYHASSTKSLFTASSTTTIIQSQKIFVCVAVPEKISGNLRCALKIDEYNASVSPMGTLGSIQADQSLAITDLTFVHDGDQFGLQVQVDDHDVQKYGYNSLDNFGLTLLDKGQEVSIPVSARTIGNGPEDGDATFWNVRNLGEISVGLDMVFLGEELLVPGDYYFTDIATYTASANPSWEVYYSFANYWKVSRTEPADSSSPTVYVDDVTAEIEYKTTTDPSCYNWTKHATIKSHRASEELKNWEGFTPITSNNVTAFRVKLINESRIYALNGKISAVLNIVPTPHVQSILNTIKSSNGEFNANYLRTDTVAFLDGHDATGRDFATTKAIDTSSSKIDNAITNHDINFHGINKVYRQNDFTGLKTPWIFHSNKTEHTSSPYKIGSETTAKGHVVDYYNSYHLPNNANALTGLAKFNFLKASINAGIIKSFTADNNFRWYFLLPKGAEYMSGEPFHSSEVITSTGYRDLSAPSPTTISSNTAIKINSVTVTPNYNGSGRQLVIYDCQTDPGSKNALIYTVSTRIKYYMPYDMLRAYGNTITVYSAMSHTAIDAAAVSTPSLVNKENYPYIQLKSNVHNSGDVAGVMTSLPGTTSNHLQVSSENIQIPYGGVSSSGSSLSVSARNEKYDTHTNITEEEEYIYRIKYIPSDVANEVVRNLMFYMNLENCHSEGNGNGLPSDWKGTLVDIDANQLVRDLDANPVIYYSYSDVDLSTKPNLSDSSTWKVFSASDPSIVKSNIKTIAIDVSKKRDGSELKLTRTDYADIYVRMQAPSGKIEGNAYNQHYVHSQLTTENVDGDPRYLAANVTTVYGPKVEPKPEILIEKSITNSPANGTGYALGESIKYELKVTNTGNVTLNNVIVKDDLTGSTFPTSGTLTLAPGESKSFTTSYSVQEKDINAGKVHNTATAEGTDDNGTKVTDDDSADATPVSPDPRLELEKTITSKPADGSKYKAGETITYSLKVTNTGNVTLYNVKVVDDITKNTFPTSGTLTLKPTESKVFTDSYVVQRSDLGGDVVNVATATGDTTTSPSDPGNKPQKATDTATAPAADKAPAIDVEKIITSTPADGSKYGIGEEIKYKITVTNIGNVTLYNVVVKDDITGDTWPNDGSKLTLDPGQSKVYTTSYKVTLADLTKGNVHNVATATGDTTTDPSDSGNKPQKDEDAKDAPTQAPNPGLSVEKHATSVPANGSYYVTGETIKYRITVRNTGNIPLYNVTVTDDLTGNKWPTSGTLTLQPGQSQSFECTYVVQEKDLGKDITNTAKATGDTTPDPSDPNNKPQSGEDSETSPTETIKPQLDVEKTTTSKPSNGKGYQLGEKITYNIKVTNTGNVTIHDVVVNDSLTGDTWPKDGSSITLAPGQSIEFQCEYTVTQADIDRGEPITNIATANGKTPDGKDVNGTDNENNNPDPKNPDLNVKKEIISTPQNGVTYVLDEVVTYKITVKNTGNVTLYNVSVTDSLTGESWKVDGPLAPGESKVFSTSYKITLADVQKGGKIHNVATAKGDTTPDPSDPNNKPVQEEDSADAPVMTYGPALTVEKQSDPNVDVYKLGETIHYTIKVSNTGNIPLYDIDVVDDLTGDTWNIPVLQVGEVQTFYCEHVVTEADINAGSIVNNVTAKGKTDYGEEVEDNDSVKDKPAAPGPALSVIKKTTSTPPNGEFYAEGDKITYHIVVTNTGNVTLYNVIVTDELTNNTWTAGTLEPGASKEFDCEYIVTDDDIHAASSVTNIAKAKGDTTQNPNDPANTPVEGEDKVKDPIDAYNPSIDLVKVVTSTPANGTSYNLGERITYKITVTNTGNIALYDLTVEDPLTKDLWDIDVLLPGEVKEFECFYEVSEFDIRSREPIENVVILDSKTKWDEPLVGQDTETADPTPPSPGIDVEKKTTSNSNDTGGYMKDETITYEITTTNTGNVTLYNVSVIDEFTDDALIIPSIEPGETSDMKLYTTHSVEDSDVNNSSVVNVAVSVGNTVENPDVTPELVNEQVTADDDVKDPVVVYHPSISVIKNEISTPENGVDYQLGETIFFEIIAVNNGDCDLKDVVVTDTNDVAVLLEGEGYTLIDQHSASIGGLAKGASVTLKAQYVITSADLGHDVINTVTASGIGVNDNTKVSDDDEEKVSNIASRHPELTVYKNIVPTENNPDGDYLVNDLILYEIYVVNTGNMEMNNIVITDELTGDVWEYDGVLAPGESTPIYETSYQVTSEDVANGGVVNTANATGTTLDGERVEAPPAQVEARVFPSEGVKEAVIMQKEQQIEVPRPPLLLQLAKTFDAILGSLAIGVAIAAVGVALIIANSRRKNKRQ